jgi:hypothetical protein
MSTLRSLALGALAAFGLALGVGLSATARADGGPADLWAVARAGLPSTQFVVMGANLAAIKGSSLYRELAKPLLDQATEVREGLDRVKKTCGIDVIDTAQGMVVAVDDKQKGAIFLATNGIDSAKVTDCFAKIGADDKTPKKITASKPDAHGVVEYSASGEKKKLYVAFLPKGVLAMATDVENKALLEKYLTSKGPAAGSPLARGLGAVNTSGALWLVVAQEKLVDPPGNVTMKAVYGTADLGGGNVSADFRVLTGNPKQAGEFAAYANKQVEDAKAGGQVPPEAQSLVKSLKIAPNGDEVQLKASLPEKEILALVQGAMNGGAAPAPAPSTEPAKK